MCKVDPGLERQLQAGFQIEERDRAVLELRSDNALRWKAERISIEGDGALQVIDAECQDSDARFHFDAGITTLCGSARFVPPRRSRELGVPRG